MKKLIVFDLDGTVVDSTQDISAAIIFAAHTVCDLPENTITNEQIAPLIGKNLDITFKALLPSQLHHHVDACVSTYRSYYVENCTRHTSTFPGMLPLLSKLKARGNKLAIATTKAQITADAVINGLNLAPYFEVVQGVNGFPSKPDPYILHLLMQRFEVDPTDMIMIGDTDNDILCAQRAGVDVCAVTWGAWSKEQLCSLNPRYLVDKVEELHDLLAI